MKKLWQCESLDEQVHWCRMMLDDGKILSDPSIFVGGADGPTIMRILRKSGMNIKTCHVRTIDAAGTVHRKTLAWKKA